MQNYDAEMKTTLELEINITGTALPYQPATMYQRNGDPGDPAKGGYCEDLCVILRRHVEEKQEDGTKKKVCKELDITDWIDEDDLENLSIELYEEKRKDEVDAREAAMEAKGVMGD